MSIRRRGFGVAFVLLASLPCRPGLADVTVTTNPPARTDLPLVSPGGVTPIRVDPAAAPVVHEAADLLASDIGRVAGPVPPVQVEAVTLGGRAVLIGTIGDGGPVDQLVSAGKVDVTGVRGQWESFAWQVVDDPIPRVGRALVIVGSDRRGTAYGCTQLSRAIGVSPWTWWADVPVPHHDHLAVTDGRHVEGPPGVRYRGLFLNDEDWGLRPWASQTFDPALGNLGPKTYARLFELMLRLRLNYLWPAMHPGSAEFGSVPGDPQMADHWAVVMGASHCEPMLRNNVYWDRADGPWRYDLNRANILKYWTESADQRGGLEAVWTLGIRGIHDRPMDGPPGTAARVKMVDGIIVDQRQLIDARVTRRYGPPAECFIPYKEVLPLYNAGLQVPADVTVVWPDDNFGYIRHLPTAAERARVGGSGIYYHWSYWGRPQSYLWVESTAPGLIWEELHKAWQNDAGRLWVSNVGDLKPSEIATAFYADLAWSPDRWGPDAQDRFLHRFFADNFGPALAGPLCDLQESYYRLACVRRPEQFTYDWLNSLSSAELADLGRRYAGLAERERAVAGLVPAEQFDAYFEMVGYAARMLAATGQLYLHDQAGLRPGHADQTAAARQLMGYIAGETARYNDRIAGGKWRRMMWTTPEDLAWPSDVGGSHHPPPVPATRPADTGRVVVDAAACPSLTPAAGGPTPAATVAAEPPARWRSVSGLGRSGSALTVLPAVAFRGPGPTAEYTFSLRTADDASAVRLDLLPTMRVDPAGHLRVAIGLDGAEPAVTAVPGGESGDENSGPRREAVMTNRVTITLPPGPLAPGRHTLRVVAVDPGVVLDQVELPRSATLGPTSAPAGR